MTFIFCKACLSLLFVLFGFFWMSHLHLTFIAIRIYVFDPQNDLEVFFSMIIALGIWTALIYLYYLLKVKIMKKDPTKIWSTGKIRGFFFCSYIFAILYLLVWLINTHLTIDFIFMGIQGLTFVFFAKRCCV